MLRCVIIPLCLATSMLAGCGDPCLDDGPIKANCNNNAASASETADATMSASESADATMSNSESGSASNSGDGDGDGDPGDGDGTPGDGDGGPGDGDGDGDGGPGDGDGDDPCMNGMQDPPETDVDCGGECVEVNPNNPDDIEGQCGEGDLCDMDQDCQAGFCDEGECNLCPDMGEFDPNMLGYNSCQSCLLTNCCAAVIDCFANIEKCVCWFNCVEHTGQTQVCMDQCGNGNIGQINSCMNNACKADNVSMNCDAP